MKEDIWVRHCAIPTVYIRRCFLCIPSASGSGSRRKCPRSSHDCCRDALEKGQVSVFVVFWFHAIRDFSVSILRERRRELMGPLDFEHPVIGIIDLMLIPSMITANLLALGPIVTLLVLGGVQIPADEFAMTSGFFSFVIGCLTVLASIVINRLRPTVRLWVKL
jgi:hypothetical protein